MYAVDPHLGTLADFEHLADALHRRGMKFVLDTVPNHVGPAHPWVEDEPTPDWFHGTAAKHIPAVGDFSAIVDPHGSDRDRIPPLQGWFADILPDMNQENPLVATYLIQNAIWWVESAGLDGLRIDTFPYVSRSFWHDFHAQLHELFPRLTTVGEVMNEDPTIVSYFAGGAVHAGVDTGLDTPFDYPGYFALRAVCIKGQPMTLLAKTLRQDSLYPHPERLVPFEGNHDVRRFLSEPGATAAELKLAFGLLATMRGMPQIYAGDEIAMEGGEDPDNRRDFPGGFPGDAQNAFTSAGRTPVQADMHDWVSSLFALRHAHPAFNGGDQQEILVTDKVFAFARVATDAAGDERLLVVANNADQSAAVKLDFKQTRLEGARRIRALLGNALIGNTTNDPVEGNAVALTVPARSLAVYQIE
jgi:glycosidase